MKMKKIIISAIISVLLLSSAASLHSVFQTRSLTKFLRNRLITIDTINNDDIDVELLLNIGEETQTNIAVFPYSKDSFKQEVKIFLSNDDVLNRLNINKDIDFNTFNSLPYNLTSENHLNEYYINFMNSRFELTLIPISKTQENIDQNIYLSAEQESHIDHFIASLSKHNVNVIETPNYNEESVGGFIRLPLAILLDNFIIIAFLLIYFYLMIHDQYQSYRNDTILRLQGYCDADILIKKITSYIGIFSVSSSISLIVYIGLARLKYDNLVGFSKSYFDLYLFVSSITIFIIIIMQVLSFRSNHLDTLRGNRRKSYVYVLVFLKTIMIPILSLQIVSDLSQLKNLYEENERLEAIMVLNSSVYTLENIPGDFNLQYWIDNNQKLYDDINRNLIILYSENYTEDAYEETVVRMNNEYFNTLGLIDVNNKSLNLESKEEIVIITNISNYDLTTQQLSRPILCSLTGLEKCDDLEVISVNDDTLIPIIGKKAEIINSPFVVITGQVPTLFTDYNFKSVQNPNIEKKLTEHLKNYPLKFVNLEEEYSKLSVYHSELRNKIIKNLTIVCIISAFLITTIYSVHYDIYKRFYSSLYLNGNSVYNIVSYIFYLQLLIHFVSFVFLIILLKNITNISVFYLLIIIVEIIAYLKSSEKLKKEIIRNIKGG